MICQSPSFSSPVTLLILALFLSCSPGSDPTHTSEPEHLQIFDTLEVLTRTIWNWDKRIETAGDHYSPLYFIDGYAYDHGSRWGKVRIDHDTIRVIDSSYYSSLDTAYEMKLLERTYLIGRIEKIDKDSLIIQKIVGSGNPFHAGDLLVLYNDSLDRNDQVQFDSLSYSTTTCYGACPEMSIALYANGSYRYFGGEYATPQGYYQGNINTSFISSISNLVQLVDLQDGWKAASYAIDAPNTKLVIYYNAKETFTIDGYHAQFPPRLQQLVNILFESPANAALNPADGPLHFPSRFTAQ